MKSLIGTIALVFMALEAFGQDPHFSQYEVTPLIVNPANAGLKHDLRAVVNYKNQWGAVATPYKTTAFSFDMRTNKGGGDNAYFGIGGQFLQDKSGDANMSLIQGNLNVSGIIKLDNYSKLSLGLMGGFGQRGTDYDNLRWESQYANGAYNSQLSSNETFATPTFSYFDAGAGIAWTYGKDQGYITANDGVKATVGFSASHFGLPAASFNGFDVSLKTKFIGHASMEVGKANTNLTFIPSLYYVQQGKQREVLFGSTFRYLLQEGSHFTGFNKSSSIGLGVHYRLKDALVTSLQVDYANYTVGISYDFNVSQLSTASNMRGGLELFLRFVTPNPFGRSSISKFR
ncbi:MAG: PorP/SprF family type IX secretion system membrane protein [Crocinitomicaceae bacterium]|nr:PorP/SprF family type IX secretion system membrane protein [Crocinitomicaceae bacterium]